MTQSPDDSPSANRFAFGIAKNAPKEVLEQLKQLRASYSTLPPALCIRTAPADRYHLPQKR